MREIIRYSVIQWWIKIVLWKYDLKDTIRLSYEYEKKQNIFSHRLSDSKVKIRRTWVNSSCAQHPRATAGHLPALSVPGVGICKFCAARGPDICQPRGLSRAFDTHAVSYQHITTQRILLGKKADWLICQGQEKIEEGCKAMFLILCMHFFIAYQARITDSEIGSYRRESTFFCYWNKCLLILFEKNPFIFVKLLITYNFTTLY